MRKKILYDKKTLTNELNYSQVPVRQILMLNLSQLSQLILFHFFSHSENWGISINQISKAFYYTKNRKRIKEALEELKRSGYVTENENNYYINLKTIQSDYQKIVNAVPKDVTNGNTSSSQSVTPPDTDSINPLLPEVTSPDTMSNSLLDTVSNNNNINNEINKEGKKKNGIEVEFDYTSSNSGLKTTGNDNAKKKYEMTEELRNLLEYKSNYFKSGYSQTIMKDAYKRYLEKYPNKIVEIEMFEKILFFVIFYCEKLEVNDQVNDQVNDKIKYLNPMPELYLDNVVEVGKVIKTNEDGRKYFSLVTSKHKLPSE